MVVDFQEAVKWPEIHRRYVIFKIEKCGMKTKGIIVRIVAGK